MDIGYFRLKQLTYESQLLITGYHNECCEILPYD